MPLKLLSILIVATFKEKNMGSIFFPLIVAIFKTFPLLLNILYCLKVVFWQQGYAVSYFGDFTANCAK